MIYTIHDHRPPYMGQHLGSFVEWNVSILHVEGTGKPFYSEKQVDCDIIQFGPCFKTYQKLWYTP